MSSIEKPGVADQAVARQKDELTLRALLDHQSEIMAELKAIRALLKQENDMERVIREFIDTKQCLVTDPDMIDGPPRPCSSSGEHPPPKAVWGHWGHGNSFTPISGKPRLPKWIEVPIRARTPQPEFLTASGSPAPGGS